MAEPPGIPVWARLQKPRSADRGMLKSWKGKTFPQRVYHPVETQNEK